MQIVSLEQILSKWLSDVLLLAQFINAVSVAGNIIFYHNHVIRNFVSNKVFCILARVTDRLSMKMTLKYNIRIEVYKNMYNRTTLQIQTINEHRQSTNTINEHNQQTQTINKHRNQQTLTINKHRQSTNTDNQQTTRLQPTRSTHLITIKTLIPHTHKSSIGLPLIFLPLTQLPNGAQAATLLTFLDHTHSR